MLVQTKLRLTGNRPERMYRTAKVVCVGQGLCTVRIIAIITTIIIIIVVIIPFSCCMKVYWTNVARPTEVGTPSKVYMTHMYISS